MSMSGLTMRLKVFFAFGMVLLVTIALGLFAVDRLGRVNGAAGELREKWLPATQTVSRMSVAFEQYRIAEGRALVAASAEAALAVETDLLERSQQVERQRADYETMVLSEEERTIVGQFRRHWDEYMALSRETMALVRQGAKDQAAEGRQVCVDLIQEARTIKGVHGVHIMAYRQEETVAEIVQRSGVLQGRVPWYPDRDKNSESSDRKTS